MSLEFRIWVLGLRFRIWGLGFMIWGLKFRVRFLIFRVLGFTDGFSISVVFLSHLFFNFITFFN